MPENIEGYKFYFLKEVEDLREILGPRADKLMFVNVDVKRPDIEGVEPKATLRHVIVGKGIRDKDASLNSEWAKEDYLKLGTYHQPILNFDDGLDDPPTIGHEIVTGDDDAEAWNFESENSPFLQFFGFCHEVGHALMPDGPKVDALHPDKECAADAYAAIRCIQKFGQDAVPILTMISWNRAFDAVLGMTAHVTTTVIDKIISDSTAYDNFSNLTADETIEKAESYAKDWAPEVSLLSEARKSFLPEDAEEFDSSLLYTTCLSSPPNRFSLYIGAKAFYPFLQPGGVLWDGEPFQFSDKRRKLYTDSIATHTSRIGLSGLFNPNVVQRLAAEPLLTETLKVAHPIGQPFTIKF